MFTDFESFDLKMDCYCIKTYSGLAFKSDKPTHFLIEINSKKLTGKQIDNMVSQLVIPSKSYFGGANAHEFNDAHDRFLINDQKELYHFGASLKDLGKKWFAFSKLEGITETVLSNINKLKTNE